MQLETVRGWQITRMELSLKTIESLFSTLSHDDMTSYRDSGDGWTVLEVLCHLRDFEEVFRERFRLAVEQDNPELPFPNPDELARANAYNDQDWQAALNDWKSNRADFIAFLKARAESDWERPARHPTRGILTLHDQLFLTALHDSIHIEQIMRIIAEKKLQLAG